MKLGFFPINNGIFADPSVMVEVSQACEAAGFDSVWTGEHVVLPDPQVPPSPVAPETPMLDPAVALAYVAARTTTLRLGTGIIIVPQRNPLVLAKEMASLDHVSGGRLILGVGVGYLAPEFAALGISMDDRGRRTEEYLDAMRAIWRGEAYEGMYASFSGVTANPRPVQTPPPVVMGGHSAPAYRRAVTSCEGWYGFAMTPESAQKSIDGLAQAAQRYERPTGLGPLELSITPRGALTEHTVAAFAAMGVNRLIPMAPATFSVGDTLTMVADLANRYLG